MNIEQLNQLIEKLSNTPSDINEHLKTLSVYASKSESIIEFGVRGIVSTWSLLLGQPKIMKSYDIVHPSKHASNIDDVYQTANNIGVDYEFILGNTLEVNIPECDLLFIDTIHRYSQLKQELEKHHTKVKKYIIFHDTVSFGDIDEFPEDPHSAKQGLLLAINEFLDQNNKWYILENFKNNNGLMILANKEFENDQ